MTSHISLAGPGDKLALTSDEVLGAIYRALLDRAPDPDGLSYWTGVLASGNESGDRTAALSEIIISFITTREGHHRLVATLANNPAVLKQLRDADAARAAIRETFLRPDAPSRLRDVICLGTHCYAASLLDSFGARAWSGPFDWVFSTPGMVRDCLRDGFETYLDQSQYRVVPIEERADPNHHRVSHLLFEHRYRMPEPVFNHTDAHTEEGHSYLQRCVARFRAAIARPGPVRFLQIRRYDLTAMDEFRSTMDTLSAHCRQPVLVQVAVRENSSPSAQGVASTIATDPRGLLLAFDSSSALGPTRFVDLMDDLVLMRAIEEAFATIAAALPPVAEDHRAELA